MKPVPILYGQKLMPKFLKTMSTWKMSSYERRNKVADVGVGYGAAAKHMCNRNFRVDGYGLHESPLEHSNYTHYPNRFEDCPMDWRYDGIWCAHTLEHIPNVHEFLQCMRLRLKSHAPLAIVVPNDRNDVLVDGHLSFWTPAHLIYNLVIAGFNCKDAEYYTQDRDIGLLVRRVDTPDLELAFDTGDLERLQKCFPCQMIARYTDPWLKDKWT